MITGEVIFRPCPKIWTPMASGNPADDRANKCLIHNCRADAGMLRLGVRVRKPVGRGSLRLFDAGKSFDSDA